MSNAVAALLGTLVGVAASLAGSALTHFTGHRGRVTERELQLRARRADAYDHLLSFLQTERLGLPPRIEKLATIHAEVVAFGSGPVGRLFNEWEDVFLLPVSDDRTRLLEEKRPGLEQAAHEDVTSLRGLGDEGDPKVAGRANWRDARRQG